MANTKYDALLAERIRGLKKSLDKHEKKIAALVNDFLTTPERSSAYWNGIRSSLNREYKEIAAVYSAWAQARYPQFYNDVVREQMTRAGALKNLANTAAMSTREIINSDFAAQTKRVLYESATADVMAGLALGGRELGRLTRITQQKLVNEWLIDKTIAAAYEAGDLKINRLLSREGTPANSLLKAAEGDRFVAILCKDGVLRHYGIGDYAELVSRTKWHEAQTAATKAVAANYSTDLVRVSAHNTTTEICQYYEGKVMSISGKSEEFEFLDREPPFHPNCLHYLTVTFEETLKSSGQFDAASDFSKGKTDQPPNLPSFIPVQDRAALQDAAIAKGKASEVYAAARSDSGRRNVLRDFISQEFAGAIA